MRENDGENKKTLKRSEPSALFHDDDDDDHYFFYKRLISLS